LGKAYTYLRRNNGGAHRKEAKDRRKVSYLWS